MNKPRILNPTTGIGLLLLAYVAFIALGMRDGLIGVAWPTMRVDFAMPLDALGILLIAGVAGYMTSSFLIGALISRLGIGRLLALGFALACATLLAYAYIPYWWALVAMTLVGGLGSGAIDAGLNTYVAAHYDEGPMQWLHASYGAGITLGPIIMTIALADLGSWRSGYLVVGIVYILVLISVIFSAPRRKPANPPNQPDQPVRLTDYKTPMRVTLRRFDVWLSAGLFFLYVGAELALGTWIYSLLTEARGIDPALAGYWTGSYWATFTIGRVIAGLYARRAGVNLLMHISLVGALVGAGLLVWNPIPVANLVAVALIGFAIAPIFPAMISGTSRRVGPRFAANTIGIQMAATGLGTAVIPGLFGVLASRFSLEIIPVCLFVVFAGLFVVYRLSTSPRRMQENVA